jgi:hypothetical protein
MWDADPLSFLPTSFGKFLTKRETPYNFKVYPGITEDWIGNYVIKNIYPIWGPSDIRGGFPPLYLEGTLYLEIPLDGHVSLSLDKSPLYLEDDTIYLKPIIDANLQDGHCRYIVTNPQDKNEYFEDEFDISPLALASFPSLKNAVMEKLSDRGHINTNGIYYKGSLNNGYYPLEYGHLVSDCYDRYQDHHTKRSLLNEIARSVFLDDPALYVPDDVTCYIAGLIYYLEEEELYGSMQHLIELRTMLKKRGYHSVEVPD